MDNLDYLKPSKRNRQKRRDKRLSEELIERWSYWNRFYVDPDTNILHNKTIKKQKGPFPKKARWKKEKQKAKIKSRLGIVTKPNNIYKYPQIKTYEQKLEIGKVYDLKHDQSHSRARFLGCDTSENQYLISFKILKSDLHTDRTTLNYFLGKRKRYHYNPDAVKKLQVFNVGTLHFELMWDKQKHIYTLGMKQKKIRKKR